MPTVKKTTPKKATKKKKSGGSVVDRIQGMSFDEGIKILIYGQSGSGKTHLWGSFPGHTLAIICSGSKKGPGELRTLNTPAMRKKIDTVSIEKAEEVLDLCNLQEETNKYQTIVLDHASGLQDVTLAEILELDQMPAQSSWGLARREDYGTCALRMKEYLRALFTLTCNVVVVAQEREFEAPDDSEIVVPYVSSALMPSVSAWLNPAADYIVQTFKKAQTEAVTTTVAKKKITSHKKTGKIDYCLRVGPSEIYTTKFRVPGGVKEEVIVNPSYDKIAALLGE